MFPMHSGISVMPIRPMHIQAVHPMVPHIQMAHGMAAHIAPSMNVSNMADSHAYRNMLGLALMNATGPMAPR